MEMIREPGKMKDRGTVDSPVMPVNDVMEREEETCSASLRGDMRMDVLRRQLEELTTKLGGYG